NPCSLKDPSQPNKMGKLNSAAKLMVALTIVDVLLAITGLVVGILGALGVISIPSGLFITGFVISGVVIGSWIISSLWSRGANFKVTKDLFRRALSCSDPNPQQNTGMRLTQSQVFAPQPSKV